MTKLTTSLTFLLLVFLAVIYADCKKQDNQPATPPPSAKPGAVNGKVVNEYSQLLPGAVLTIQKTGTNTSVTSTDGNYSFSALAPGSYNLSVKKDGYIETSATVSISTGDTLSKDFVLKAGTAYLNLLTDSVIMAKPFAGTFTLKIASNTNWSLTNANDWITTEKSNGAGDDSIIVRIAASTLDTMRQGILTLQAGSITKNILVYQTPDVKLKQVVPLPGNLAINELDSIAILFNQPVTIKSIFPGNTFCQSDIKFTYSGNKVTFSYACAALGGDYPFTITTQNSLGDQYTFTFTAGFYEKAINLTGTIQSYFVNDADNSYWIITDHPNALYKIDMTSLDILHKYDLPNEPAMFTVNPYNNKIYIAYNRIPKLFVLNQDGSTNQVIEIPHDTTRGIYEYDGPMIYPAKLVFTKNGKGMIWLGDIVNRGYSTFWFIDAAANHRIWYQTLPGVGSNSYLDAKTNFDQTKLILTSGNDDPTIGTFDPQQMTFSNYKPTKFTRGTFVAPSRKNGNVYSGQLYNQLIVNPVTGFESLESYKDNRNFGNVDFCYKPGKDQTIYFTEQGYIEVLDYTNHTTPVYHDAIPFLKGTTTTLDGKHIIVNRHDGNYNAKVIQLPTAWFDY